MPQAMIDLYNSLSAVKQQEVFKYAIFLKFFEEHENNELVTLMKEISKSAEENGISDMTLDEINAEIDLVRAKNAFKELRSYAKENLPEMSMEEINAEIKAVRAKR